MVMLGTSGEAVCNLLIDGFPIEGWCDRSAGRDAESQQEARAQTRDRDAHWPCGRHHTSSLDALG